MKKNFILIIVFILVICTNFNCVVPNNLANNNLEIDTFNCNDTIKKLNDSIEKCLKIINKSKSTEIFNNECYVIFENYISFITNGTTYKYDSLYINNLFLNTKSCYYKNDNEFNTLKNKYNEFKKLCFFINASENCEYLITKSEYLINSMQAILKSNNNESQKKDLQKAINNVQSYKSENELFNNRMYGFTIDLELAVKSIDTTNAIKKLEIVLLNKEFENECIINKINDTITKYKK